MQKIQFLGCVRRSGISKAGKNYDIFSLSFITPVKVGEMGTMTVDGIGFEAKEMPVDETVFFQLKQNNIKSLSEINVDVQMDINNPKRSKIVSYKLAEK